VHFLARALEKLLKAAALGIVNRIAGVLFAVLRTAFLLSVILVVLNTIDRRAPFIPDEHKENSLLYRPLSSLAPAIFPYLDFDGVRKRIPRSEAPEIEA
jgi:membrane protein required for colicin V production